MNFLGNPAEKILESVLGLVAISSKTPRELEKIEERTFTPEKKGTAMSDFTFEAWCTPTVDLPGVADHTFVYCPDAPAGKKKYFYCWGGGDINERLSARVMRESGKNAYHVANCYRTPMEYAGALRPDTAALGGYLINGVCHQSANLFMYAASWDWMELTVVDRKLRPMGLPVSYLAYGPRGVPLPGLPPELHWLVWWADKYKPCADKHGLDAAAEDARKEAVLARLAVKVDSTTMPTEDDNRRLIVAQFAAFVEESQPTIMGAMGLPATAEPINPDRFADRHMDFLREKDQLIAADYKPRQPGASEALAEGINNLTIDFQKQLEGTLGPQGYTQVTGLAPGEYVRIVDPRIVGSQRG